MTVDWPGTVPVIIPTYNGGAKLARCLSTFRQFHPKAGLWELAVVLDGGPDPAGTEKIAKEYGAKFILRTENGGFSKAVNAGLAATAHCAVKILLNDDVYFEADACTKLVAAFKDPEVWVAGTRLLFPDKRIQHGGMHSDFQHCHVGKPANDPAAVVDRDIFAVTGALMALSEELLAKVGGLDESFGLSWEDSDLCMQAHRFGKRIRYVGSTWAYHEQCGTRRQSNTEWRHWETSGGARFQEKWGPKAEWPKVKLHTRGFMDANERIEKAVKSAEVLSGWMIPVELRWLADQASTRNVVVEVGSWKGRSTKALAIATPGIVYSVDHWLATPPPSDVSKTKGDWKLVSQVGPKHVMDLFLKNLKDEISAGKCTPLNAPSIEGASRLKTILGDRKVDMVFIDADHEYNMVSQDIKVWREMLAPGGLLCGHDYHKDWPGVVKAVHELVPKFAHVPGTMIWYEKA